MRSGLHIALSVAATASRVIALAYVALALANALVPAEGRVALLALNGFFSRLVPGPLLGLLVIPTPFEGALRGDFVIAAIVFLVLGWLLSRASASLR